MIFLLLITFGCVGLKWKFSLINLYLLAPRKYSFADIFPLPTVSFFVMAWRRSGDFKFCTLFRKALYCLASFRNKNCEISFHLSLALPWLYLSCRVRAQEGIPITSVFKIKLTYAAPTPSLSWVYSTACQHQNQLFSSKILLYRIWMVLSGGVKNKFETNRWFSTYL